MKILSSDLIAFDIAKPENKRWLGAFKDLIKCIEDSPKRDRLTANYLGLHERLDAYESFTIITKEDRVVGFSGMHGSHFPSGHSRVLSRLYYHPSIRANSLSGRKLPSLAIRFMLPIQIQVAQQLGVEIIFMSFAGLNRREFCKRLLPVLQAHSNQGWQLEPKMHCTAKLLLSGEINMNSDVWQNIISLPLQENATLKLPAMTITEWEERYGQGITGSSLK
jgi:hypothetical protein